MFASATARGRSQSGSTLLLERCDQLLLMLRLSGGLHSHDELLVFQIEGSQNLLIVSLRVVDLGVHIGIAGVETLVEVEHSPHVSINEEGRGVLILLELHFNDVQVYELKLLEDLSCKGIHEIAGLDEHQRAWVAFDGAK